MYMYICICHAFTEVNVLHVVYEVHEDMYMCHDEGDVAYVLGLNPAIELFSLTQHHIFNPFYIPTNSVAGHNTRFSDNICSHPRLPKQYHLLQQSCAQNNTFNLTNSLHEALHCVYVYLVVYRAISQ